MLPSELAAGETGEGTTKSKVKKRTILDLVLDSATANDTKTKETQKPKKSKKVKRKIEEI